MYELKLLNLETGALETIYRLTNPFAEKVRIANGQAYFLYKAPQQQNRRLLYKAPLSNF